MAALSGGASAFPISPVPSCRSISSQLSTACSPPPSQAMTMMGSSGAKDGLPMSRRDILGAFGTGAVSTLAFGVAAAQAKVREINGG